MCAILRGRGRDVLLFLAGDGPERDVVEQRSVDLGLEDQVRFLGRIGQQELMQKMAEADIGVFPSYREMMPFSVLEMMATGLPVVAYEAGGVADSLESGRSGYLVPIGHKEMFLNRLTHLLDHPLETRTMGKAARERVETHFALEVVAAKLIEVYEHLIRNRDNE
jgi:glycosyltransferase involved in cell wall biosynthesis